MAHCEDCIYHKMCYWIAVFGEKTPCEHFIATADVASKSEVAREIFEEIEDLFFNKYLLGNITASLFEDKYAELKKKYTGE